MLSHFNLVMPTIYIGDSDLFLEDDSKMELLDDFNMGDIHPNMNLEIKSDGTNTETNFKIKKNSKRENKRKEKEDNIDIINNNSKNNNKITKPTKPTKPKNKIKITSLEEKRARNKIAAQKCRKKKQLQLEETLKLISTLKKELEEANGKIHQLKQIINN